MAIAVPSKLAQRSPPLNCAGLADESLSIKVVNRTGIKVKESNSKEGRTSPCSLNSNRRFHQARQWISANTDPSPQVNARAQPLEVAKAQLNARLAARSGAEGCKLFPGIESITGRAPRLKTAIVFSFNRPKHQNCVEVRISQGDFMALALVTQGSPRAAERVESNVNFLALKVKSTVKRLSGISAARAVVSSRNVKIELLFVSTPKIGVQASRKGHDMAGAVREALLKTQTVALKAIGKEQLKVKGINCARFLATAKSESQGSAIVCLAILNLPG